MKTVPRFFQFSNDIPRTLLTAALLTARCALGNVCYTSSMAIIAFRRGNQRAFSLLVVAACVSDDTSPPGAGPRDSGVPGVDALPSQDAGAREDVVEAGPQTFCMTQMKPLSATDFLCADFDQGPVQAAFDSIREFTPLDAGTPSLSLTTMEFVSSPNSLLTIPPGSTAFGNRGATLVWDRPGAKAVSQIDLAFSLNRGPRGGVVAPAAGKVVVAKIGDPESSAAFAYADGAMIEMTANYTGFFLDEVYAGAGGAIRDTKKVPTPPNGWTRISMKYASDGTLVLSYNDIEQYRGKAIAYSGTSARGEVGAYGAGPTAFPHNYRIDNVVVSVARKP
jgi:hypothetical protein